MKGSFRSSSFQFEQKMEYKIVSITGDNNPSLVFNLGNHTLPQVTQFYYHGSLVQNDTETSDDVNHRLQVG